MVSPLLWNRSGNIRLLPPVLARYRNMESCSSAETYLLLRRPWCNWSSCDSLRYADLCIPICSWNQVGCPTRSSSNHRWPVKMDVRMGWGVNVNAKCAAVTAAENTAEMPATFLRFLCECLWFFRALVRAILTYGNQGGVQSCYLALSQLITWCDTFVTSIVGLWELGFSLINLLGQGQSWDKTGDPNRPLGLTA